MSRSREVTELTARVVGQDSCRGTVVHYFERGIGVYFPDESPEATIGAELDLELASNRNAHAERARLVSSESLDGATLCRFTFVDPVAALDRAPPEIAALFNRRGSRRVPITAGRTGLQVRLLRRGEPSTICVTIRDISATGLSFREEPDTIGLVAGERVGIEIELENAPADETGECRVQIDGTVRYCEPSEDGGLRYGVRFDFDDSTSEQSGRVAIERIVQSLVRETTFSL